MQEFEEQEGEEIKEEDLRTRQDFNVGTRRNPNFNNVLMMVGDLLQPQTTGFDHINLDMSFTYQDRYGIEYVKNTSHIITFCSIHGLKKSEFIGRSDLATHLNAYRSLDGKSMQLFNTTVTSQKTEFVDKTEKKTGFSALFSRRKKDGES